MSKDSIWDSLFFHGVHEIMGGHVEMLFSASAPVSKEVMRFFRCASGCLVIFFFFFLNLSVWNYLFLRTELGLNGKVCIKRKYAIFQVFEAYGLSEVGASTLTLMSEHDSG